MLPRAWFVTQRKLFIALLITTGANRCLIAEQLNGVVTQPAHDGRGPPRCIAEILFRPWNKGDAIKAEPSGAP